MDYRRGQQLLQLYKELCKKVYGDPDKKCGGVMSTELIAEHMGITHNAAIMLCDEMIEYGITEKQNGMIVV